MLCPGGKLYEKVGIVGLDFCLVGGFIADGCAASIASVNDDVSLFGVGLCPYRAEYSAAIVCPVTRIYINVKRAKAKRTVIARGIAKGHDLFAAIFAYKAGIVF